MSKPFSAPPTTNPYANPQAATWLGSCEGVPQLTWPLPAETVAEQAARADWQEKLNDHFAALGGVLPGIGLAIGLGLAGIALSDLLGKRLLGFEKSPFSAIMLVIVLGLIIRNTVGLPNVYEKGLRLCVKKILRVGIALFGIRLSLGQIKEIGLISVPVVVGVIIAGLVLVSYIGKLFGLPRRLATLIAVGTSICGVSAIAATAPAIDAEEDEVSYSVACIALFGMICLFVYPFIAHGIFGADPALAGILLGTGVHDTSQVAGAALMYQQQYGAKEAFDAAIVTKLTRNLCMIVVIPLMAVLYHRNSKTDSTTKTKLYKLVPLFVIGFVAMAILRSIGDMSAHPFLLLEKEIWENLTSHAIDLAKWCLILAMAAVGLGTSFNKLKNLGWKPFTVGFFAASLVGCVSVGLIKLVVWLG